jgi:hypothetical protein
MHSRVVDPLQDIAAEELWTLCKILLQRKKRGKFHTDVTYQIGRRRVVVGQFEEICGDRYVDVFGAEGATCADLCCESIHNPDRINTTIQQTLLK